MNGTCYKQIKLCNFNIGCCGWGRWLIMFSPCFTPNNEAVEWLRFSKKTTVLLMDIKKILLVDDDEGINFLHKIKLRELAPGCRVDIATNGEQALDVMAASDCPEIVFLDINMPVMDGFEFLNRLDATQKCYAHSKIFMVTSSVMDSDRETAGNYEIVKGYFEKPLTEEHVQKALDIVNSL